MDLSVWYTRWGGAGPSGKDTYLAKIARHPGTAPGATYVTSMPSKPYIRPSVPRRLHALSGSLGPGLHVISVPDTSQASLMAISDLTSLVRIQSESIAAAPDGHRTVHRATSASAHHVSADAPSQRQYCGTGFRCGSMCGGVWLWATKPNFPSRLQIGSA